MFEILIESNYTEHGRIGFVAIRQKQNERSKSYKWQGLIVAHTEITASVITVEDAEGQIIYEPMEMRGALS